MKIRKAVIIMITLNLCLMGLLFLHKQDFYKSAMSFTKGDRKIALTFDDGPHPSCTEELLDGLKERNVQATFFVTGQNAEKYPDIIRRAKKESHLIGNHTYSHMQLTKRNEEAFKKELVRTNDILKKITGEDVLFVRPPYGCWSKNFEKELNMLPVLWNIDPLDWCSEDAECISNIVLSKIRINKNKGKEIEHNWIILLHDQYDTSVEAAFMIVDELQKEGYTFVTVEEILLD